MAVESVVKYRCSDGSVWSDVVSANRTEALIDEVAALSRRLGPIVERSNERRLHDASELALIKGSVVDICRREYPREAIFKHEADQIHPSSYAGRFLSEVGGPLSRIWFRFQCIDAAGFEYQQPFFALNPDKWTDQQEENS